MKKLRTKKVPENANNITKGIVSHIKGQGFWASRINTLGVYDSKSGTYRKTTQQKGFSDVLAVVNGKAVFIEVKFGKDRLSLNQRKFRKDVTSCEAIYLVVETWDQYLNEVWKEILKHCEA